MFWLLSGELIVTFIIVEVFKNLALVNFTFA
jgi:hypothetical protein